MRGASGISVEEEVSLQMCMFSSVMTAHFSAAGCA